MSECECGLKAEGVCQLCRLVFCGGCYEHHECTGALNVHCNVCSTGAAEFTCLCEFPCVLLCHECAAKHDIPLHVLLPASYRALLSPRDEYVRVKARLRSLQGLGEDLENACFLVNEAKRTLDQEASRVLEAVTTFTSQQQQKLDEVKQRLACAQSSLKAHTYALLFDRQTADPLTRLLDPSYEKIPKTFRFSVEWPKLQMQATLACSLDDLLKGSAKSNICASCQQVFVGATDSDLASDFCSSDCYRSFQREAGLVNCRYCDVEFAKDDVDSVVLPCGLHAYHSSNCFLRYLLKRSRFFSSGRLFACEKCGVHLKEKSVAQQMGSEDIYAKFQNTYRSRRCEKCSEPAEVLTDCNHVLCAKCALTRNSEFLSVCPVCGAESFPDCEVCELNGEMRLSCSHVVCSLCLSEDAPTCPACSAPATVVARAPKRQVDRVSS